MMFNYFKQKKAENTRKANWVLEKQRLIQLRQDLSKLGGFPQTEEGAFDYAVQFFQVMSEFQDKGGIWNAPKDLLEEQSALNSHIENSGRCTYGINRTERGERVTLDNTYWGDRFGLFTHTGRYWKESESLYSGFAAQWLKDPSNYEQNPTTQKVLVDFQVKPFVNSHLSRVIDLCDQLAA
jgi:hypothetical protein